MKNNILSFVLLACMLLPLNLYATGIDSTAVTTYKPQHYGKLAEVTRLAPGVVMLGMKAAGVPSRSSWGDMIASDAASCVFMVGSVELLKHTIHETRPDGTDNKSFPSGHAATAFMTATMLSKEYGHISPWITVGAYGMATTTAVLRVVDNHHHVGDVIAGAALGYLSTELGYWVVKQFKKKKQKKELVY